MWRRRVAGFGVLLVCVLVGCSDAPTGDASGIGEVVNGETPNPPEEPQSPGPEPVAEPKTDMLLAAIVTAAEDNDPLPAAKDEKDKKSKRKGGKIPNPRGAINIRQFVSSLRTKNSEKPHEVRHRIQEMFPN